MTKTAFVDVGTRVERKRDGATGVVVKRHRSVNRMTGGAGRTLLDVRLDDYTLRTRAGGDMTGDLDWFTSYFRVKGGR